MMKKTRRADVSVAAVMPAGVAWERLVRQRLLGTGQRIYRLPRARAPRCERPPEVANMPQPDPGDETAFDLWDWEWDW